METRDGDLIVGPPRGAQLIKIADKISNLRLDEQPPRWSDEGMLTNRQFAADVITGARGVSEALEQMADSALGPPKTG